MSDEKPDPLKCEEVPADPFKDMKEYHEVRAKAEEMDDKEFQVPFGQFTFNVEGHDYADSTRKPHVPATEYSGVTLGRGFDLGQFKFESDDDKRRSKQQVRSYLEGLSRDLPEGDTPLTKPEIEKLVGATGKKGQVAKRYFESASLDSIEISEAQQRNLFGAVYASQEATVIRVLCNTYRMNKFGKKSRGSDGRFVGVIDWLNLDPRIRAILVDFKYVGHLFGKEGDETCTKEKEKEGECRRGYINYGKKDEVYELYEAIYLNCNAKEGTTEKEDSYNTFKRLLSDPKIFCDMYTTGNQRYFHRMKFLEMSDANLSRWYKDNTKDPALQNDPERPFRYYTSICSNGEVTWEIEKRRPNPGQPYVPKVSDEAGENASGIIVGAGYNLRTRHYFKGGLNLRKSYNYPEPIASPPYKLEVVRPVEELEAHLKVAGLDGTKIAKFKEAHGKKGKAARDWLKVPGNKAALALNEKEQKKLLNIAAPLCEADIVLMANFPTVVDAYGRKGAGYQQPDWSKISKRMRDVLVDISFTGNYQYKSRRFLIRAIGSTNSEELSRVLINENWRWDWKKSKSLVIITPTQEFLDFRQQQWRKHLSEDKGALPPDGVTVPIINSEGPASGSDSRVLPILEPGKMDGGGAQPRIIPEMIKLIWKYIVEDETVEPEKPETPEAGGSSFVNELESSDEALSVDATPFWEGDDSEPTEDSSAPETEDGLDTSPYKIYRISGNPGLEDLFFPHPDYRCLVKPKKGANFAADKTTDKLIVPNDVIAKGVENLKIRFAREGIEREYVKVISSEGNEITLEKPVNFGDHEGLVVDFEVPFELPINKFPLSGLLGDAASAIRSLAESINEFIKNINKYAHIELSNDGMRANVPLKFTLQIGDQKLRLHWNLDFEWKRKGNKWSLKSGRTYLMLPAKEKTSGQDAKLVASENLSQLSEDLPQLIDFKVFTLEIPPRKNNVDLSKKSDNEKEKQCDIYLDLNKRELGFMFGGMKSAKEKKDVKIYFPGGLKTHNEDEKKKRFVLELEKFNPDNLESKNNQVYLRLNSKGLSVKAKVTSEKVIAQPKGGSAHKAIEFKPLEKATDGSDKGKASQIVIVDNVIKEASVFARMILPGFEKLEASLSATLKQEKPGEIPSVVAGIHLENSDESPLAELNLKMLQMKLDAIRLSLGWRPAKEGVPAQWDLDAFVDGSISLRGLADLIPDLEDLKKLSALTVENLNLKDFNFPKIGVDLNLPKPTKINILDGLFTCDFSDLKVDWSLKTNTQGTFICKETNFSFNYPGALEVAVSAGEVHVRFDQGRFDIQIPSPIGLSVKIGSAISFFGEFGWEENDHERYMFASGALRLEGMPEFRALLKIGTLIKENGEVAPNIVLYADTELEMELFAGVVLKRIGGGIGINNRLKAIGNDPTPSQILEKIDTIEPHKLKAWEGVFDRGFYLSLIASATFASNRGSPQAFNAYVMDLVLSLDTNLDLIAAGKLWLASSTKYASDNSNNPALVGALVLSPRRRSLSVDLKTRPNPAIESCDLLKGILEKTRAELAFRLTPELVDYHIKEISYRDKLLSDRENIAIIGNYRLAIFRRAFLVKAGLSITGHIRKSLRGGLGGFTCEGLLAFRAEYGGLFSARGINLYGLVEAELSFYASAFIVIEFRISFKIFRKRITIRFSIRFSVSLPRVYLRFRGALALSERGAVGFDGLVGIGISICGYMLEIEPHLSFNSHVVDEVRNRVIAFERDLDRYSKESEDESKRSVDNEPAHHFLAPSSFAESLETTLTLSPSLNVHSRTSSCPVESEKWLCYSAAFKEGDAVRRRYGFVPNQKSAWFIPFREEKGNDIEPLEDVKKIAIGKQLGSELAITKIEVLKEAVASVNKPIQIKVFFELPKGTSAPKLPEKGLPVVLTCEQNFQNVWYVASLEDSSEVAPKFAVLDLLFEGEQEPKEIKKLPSPVSHTVKASLYTPKFVLYTPWDLDNCKRFWQKPVAISDEASNVQDKEMAQQKRDDALAFFLDSTEDKSVHRKEPPCEVECIYDPRVESPSREFMSFEDQLLPEGILSAHFQKPKDPSKTDRGSLEMITKYESLISVIAKEKRHGSFDKDPELEKKQVRANMMHIFLSDLNEKTQPDDIRFPTGKRLKNTKNSDPVEVFGLIFEESETSSATESFFKKDGPENDAIFIQRSGHTGIAACLEKPDKQAETTLGNRIKDLPIRQNFVLEQTQTGADELGKIVVSLPLKYDSELFSNEEQAQIGRIRVYRVEGKQEVLLTDQAQPTFFRHRGKKEIARGVGSYDSSNGTFSFASNDKKSIEDALKKAEKEEQIIELTLGLPEGKSRSLILSYDPSSLAAQVTGDLTGLESKGEYLYVVTSWNKKAQMLVVPYLITDEIPVRNREFVDQKFANKKFLEYRFELVPSGQGAWDSKEADRQPWGAVPLHIPPKKPALEELSLVFSVQSLVEGGPSWGHFQVVSSESGKPWKQFGADYELWAKELPKRKTGFYAGESDAPIKEKGSDKPQLKDIDSERLHESVDGKFRVQFKVLSQGLFSIHLSAGVFRSDCGYQFYLRPKGQLGQSRLLPMTHSVVRQMPKDWDENYKYRSVEQVEWVPKDAYEQIVQGSDSSAALASLEQFNSIGFFDKHQSNFIDTRFEGSDVDTGGAEVFYLDHDEPGYLRRQQCELMEESVFARDKRDFRVASMWQIPMWQARLVRKVDLKPSNWSDWKPAPLDNSVPSPVPALYYNEDSELIGRLEKAIKALLEVIKVTNSTTDISLSLDKALEKVKSKRSFDEVHKGKEALSGVVSKLEELLVAEAQSHEKKAVELLKEKIGEVVDQASTIASLSDEIPLEKVEDSLEAFRNVFSLQSDWKEALYPKARKVLIEIKRFELSSLNIDFPQINEAIEGIRRYVAGSLIGQSTDLTLEDFSKVLNDTQGEINKLEASDMSDMQSLEVSFALRLAGILRRRLYVVEDLFDFTPVDQLPLSFGPDQANRMGRSLPSENRWVEFVEEYQSARLDLETSGEAGQNIKLFAKQIASYASKSNQTNHLGKLNESLKSLQKNLKKGSDYIEALTRVVPLAGALVSILDELPGEDPQTKDPYYTVLKRAHHNILINETTQPYQPESAAAQSPKVSFKHFMPDSIRKPEKAGESEEGKSEKPKLSKEAKSIHLSSSRLALDFFNFMEYLGFAVDIALVKQSNDLLNYASLIEEVRKVLKGESLEDYLPFTFAAVAPNTVSSQDPQNGYSFTKVGVIPKGLFGLIELTFKKITLEASNQLKVEVDKDEKEDTLKAEGVYVCLSEGQEKSFLITSVEKVEEGDKKYFIVTLDTDAISQEFLEDVEIKSYEIQSLFLDLLVRRGLIAEEKTKEGKPISDFSKYLAKIPPNFRKYLRYMGYMLDQLINNKEGAGQEHSTHITLEIASRRWMTLPSVGGYAKTVFSPNDRYGHRYRLGIRYISRYEPLVNWMLGRPVQFFELPEYNTIKESLRLVHLKPIEHGVKRNSKEHRLLVYKYPSPKEALFSFQLPSHAARSLKNQIASVRTGYKGYDMAFMHELYDGDPAKPIKGILKHMVPVDKIDLSNHVGEQALAQRVDIEPNIRLFDHERLVRLRALPYFYKYYINVRALYDSEEMPTPFKEKASPELVSTKLDPAQLHTFDSQITQREEGEYWIYDFTVHMTRNSDNLTKKSSQSSLGIDKDPPELIPEREPYPLRVIRPASQATFGTIKDDQDHTILARDLPDCSTDYNIYWGFKEGQTGTDPKYYLSVASVRMPWSEDHGIGEEGADEDKLRPRLKDLTDQFSIHSVGPEHDELGDKVKEAALPIEFHFDSSLKYTHAYRVQFSLKIAKEDAKQFFNEVDQFYLQIVRNGALAPKLAVTATSKVSAEEDSNGNNG